MAQANGVEAAPVDTGAIRRFAILETEDAPAWSGVNERMWQGALKQAGDVWKLYQCHNSVFPSTEVREQDVIIVTGSHHSSNDEATTWIKELKQRLPIYVKQGVRVIGVCFGHQLLARAFGGTVGKNPTADYVLGIQKTYFNAATLEKTGLADAVPHLLADPAHPELSVASAQHYHPLGHPISENKVVGSEPPPLPSPAATDSADSTTENGGDGGSSNVQLPLPVPVSESDLSKDTLTLRLLESHGEQVLELPEGAHLIASSETAKVEMLALGSNVLSFQFHPEVTPQLLYDKVWTELTENKRFTATESSVSQQSLLGSPPDSAVFHKLLQHFISHGIANA